jgi:hypothetical protein
MRCVACDKQLADWEATNRSTVTNEFLDLCRECLFDAGVTGTKNPALKEKENDD